MQTPDLTDGGRGIRALVVITPWPRHPTLGERTGIARVEVYSPSGDPRAHIAASHDFCPEIPEGESWGQVNLTDRVLAEQLARLAFTDAQDWTWEHGMLFAALPHLQAADHDVAAARQRLEIAGSELADAERRRAEAEAYRVI